MPDMLVEHRPSLEPDVYLIDTLEKTPAPTVRRRQWKPRPNLALRLGITLVLAFAAAAVALPSYHTGASGLATTPSAVSPSDPDGSQAAAILLGDVAPGGASAR